MIDYEGTTLDWQKHAGDIAVLPVGSIEQHAAHLPLCTDNVIAEECARFLAEELDAALLPPLCYGTSFEHTGFRGSVSLRPETFMAVVRDLAEEVERQNFRILLVVNGHGGNFSLNPVCRDWNRRDHALKILLVPCSSWCRPDSPALPPGVCADIHAGAVETSTMMALRPDLVGTDFRDGVPADGEPFPLQQADFVTFGVGHFNSEGALWQPSAANAENGNEGFSQAREKFLGCVKDRIERLRKCWLYSGAGGIAVRPMTENDIAEGERQGRMDHWSKLRADWPLYARDYPGGAFVAVRDGHVIGTAAAFRFSLALGRIGMMVVEEAFRGLGAGTKLFAACMEALAGCATICLDASPMGKPLYEKHGFVADGCAVRLVSAALPALEPAGAEICQLRSEDLPAAAALDAAAVGADRAAALRLLREETPGAAWKLERCGKLAGFCCGRIGLDGFGVGPLAAENETDARALFLAAASALRGRRVAVLVPETQTEFAAWLGSLGFFAERRCTRMRKGPPVAAQKPGSLFALSNFAIG